MNEICKGMRKQLRSWDSEGFFYFFKLLLKMLFIL